MRKYLLVIIAAVLGFSGELNAQLSGPSDSLQAIVFGKYIKMASGFSSVNLRDRGNSALYYRGFITSTETSLFKSNARREFEMAVGVANGNLFSNSLASVHSQSYRAFSFSVYQLYDAFTKNRLHIKIGAGLSSQLNTRINTELFNTYSTVENFSSINLLARLDYYFTASAREGRLLGFISYKRPDRIFKLSYRLSGSVLPLAFRPGYAYVDNIVVNNPDYLSDHRLTVSGYSINSEVSLTRYLRNKNAVAISYRWNAITAKRNQFEAATHSLALSFFFNYK